MEECESLDSEMAELQECQCDSPQDIAQDDEDEVEELRNSLREVVQDQSVRPKLQCLMVDPSFSMVTVQSEDSGIVWETASSRCSTPWASEASYTSEAYSMEGSGGAQGKITVVFDEEKIIRRRKKTEGKSRLGERLRRPGSSRSGSALGVERPEMAEVSVPNVRVEDPASDAELAELKDKDQQLFSLISEGYEILNIRVPSKLQTVDEEESTELQDNLSYLEETPRIRSKSRWAIPQSAQDYPGLVDMEEGTQEDGEEKNNAMISEPMKSRARKDGASDMDYFEHFTLLDEVVPDEKAPEPDWGKTQAEELKPGQETATDSHSAAEETFVFITDVDIASENLDEVFYGNELHKAPEDPSRGREEEEEKEEEGRAGKPGRRESVRSLKESGSVLFSDEETILTPIFLSPGPPKIIDPILLEEPTAMSFLYSDLYEDAMGERRRSDDECSEAESTTSERSFRRQLSDSDDGDGYLEKFTLKDTTPTLADHTDSEEDTGEGLRMWSQSKFEMTGCLIRVVEEKEEEEEKEESKVEVVSAAESSGYLQPTEHEETTEGIEKDADSIKISPEELEKIEHTEPSESMTDTLITVPEAEAADIKMTKTETVALLRDEPQEEIKKPGRVEKTESIAVDASKGSEVSHFEQGLPVTGKESEVTEVVIEGKRKVTAEVQETESVSREVVVSDAATHKTETLARTQEVREKIEEVMVEEVSEDIKMEAAVLEADKIKEVIVVKAEAPTEAQEPERISQEVVPIVESLVRKPTVETESEYKSQERDKTEEAVKDTTEVMVQESETQSDSCTTGDCCRQTAEAVIQTASDIVHDKVQDVVIDQLSEDIKMEAAVLETEVITEIQPIAETETVAEVQIDVKTDEAVTKVTEVAGSAQMSAQSVSEEVVLDKEEIEMAPKAKELEKGEETMTDRAEVKLEVAQEHLSEELVSDIGAPFVETEVVAEAKAQEMEVVTEKVLDEPDIPTPVLSVPQEVVTDTEEVTTDHEPTVKTEIITEGQEPGTVEAMRDESKKRDEIQAQTQVGTVEDLEHEVVPKEEITPTVEASEICPSPPALVEVEGYQEEERDMEADEGVFSPLRSFSPQDDLSGLSREAVSPKMELHREAVSPETELQMGAVSPETELPRDANDEETVEEYEMITQQEAREMFEKVVEVDSGMEKKREGEREKERGLDLTPDEEPIEAGYDIIDAEEESEAREAAELQGMDWYCLACGCLLSETDCVSGVHQDHEVTSVERASEEIREKLGEWISELQERSENIEDLVSELELAYNSVEDQCKDSEEVMQVQNEEMMALVMEQYNGMSLSMEEEKKAKLEQLYDQIVSFQESIDSAKVTLETTAREADTDARSPKDIDMRLTAALQSAMSLELGPRGLLVFEDYAKGNSANTHTRRKGIPVPQKPSLQPQERGSASSTSVTVYWRVNPGDIIDCFQVYCVEEPQGAVAEEYRVTVKESYCVLEELDPDKVYKVWVMAVNYTGCSLPSERLSFGTAPSVPVIDTERCSVLWDSATLRWSAISQTPTQSYTLEYCRQYALEGEGLRSISGIRDREQRVLLQPNENYLFYIKAVNEAGASDQSEAALISTKGTRFHLLKASAHPALELSEDHTTLHYHQDTYNETENAANECASILGEILPERGHHYWETIVTGCTAYRVGVAHGTANRDSPLGENSASWCLRCIPTPSSCRFELLHASVQSDVFAVGVTERVGTLLDYQRGRLSFYNAQSGQLLGTLTHCFTQPCHPALGMEQPGSLEVSMALEVPEFTKHS